MAFHSIVMFLGCSYIASGRPVHSFELLAAWYSADESPQNSSVLNSPSDGKSVLVHSLLFQTAQR